MASQEGTSGYVEDDIWMDVPPPPLSRQQDERLTVVKGVINRIYESDEFAEVERKQASGEAEIIYDKTDPNDPSRRPVFDAEQVVLTRDGVAFGFLTGAHRGVETSSVVEFRGRRIITTSAWTRGSDVAGVIKIVPPVGEERFVTLIPKQVLSTLETVATIFSRDEAPAEPQTNA